MPLQIISGDITEISCDAIVNPTNKKMIGYSGIDEAVHRLAGEELSRECEKIAPVELGFAKITSGYNLKCKYIIHTVGPAWYGGNHGERALLKSCYEECLRLAIANKCETVAFPLISSGNRGCPKDMVLHYAVDVISRFLLEYDTDISVYICIYDKDEYEFSQQLLDEIDSFINSNSEEVRFYSACAKMSPRLVSLADSTGKKEKQTQPPKPSSSTETPKFKDLSDFLKTLDKPFIDILYELMDEKGMCDVECYKKANVSRKTFNKLKNGPTIRPSKEIALAFAIALNLSYDETQELLATAGWTLSNSSKLDLIVQYFIMNEDYDIFKINEVLFDYDQKLLGSSMN